MANCRVMANAAPTTAATICATNRVRRGPSHWNIATMTTIATGAASIASATATK